MNLLAVMQRRSSRASSTRASIKVAIDPALCLVCERSLDDAGSRYSQQVSLATGLNPFCPRRVHRTAAKMALAPVWALPPSMHAGRTQRWLMEQSQKIGGPFFCMRNVLLMFGVWCLVLGVWGTHM
jgi:hypothetical protein